MAKMDLFALAFTSTGRYLSSVTLPVCLLHPNETHKALYTYSDPENPQILPIREGDYLEEIKGIELPEGWILMR